MDKRTLKSTIIELKDDGKTFQEISDILAKEHSIQMTRQAVYGMYKRATSDDLLEHNKLLILITNDIMNYNALGLSDKQIQEILLPLDDKIKVSEVHQIVVSNSDYMIDIRDEQVKRIMNAIENGHSIKDITNSLSFKNQIIKQSKLNELIKIASDRLVEKYATQVLAKVFNTTEDRDAVKHTIDKFNMNISFKDIGKIINNN